MLKEKNIEQKKKEKERMIQMMPVIPIFNIENGVKDFA